MTPEQIDAVTPNEARAALPKLIETLQRLDAEVERMHVQAQRLFDLLKEQEAESARLRAENDAMFSLLNPPGGV